MIRFALLLWSCGLIAQQSKEYCYCEHTKMLYTKQNGMVVDSVNMRELIRSIKNKENSDGKSMKIDYLFKLMEYNKCK